MQNLEDLDVGDAYSAVLSHNFLQAPQGLGRVPSRRHRREPEPRVSVSSRHLEKYAMRSGQGARSWAAGRCGWLWGTDDLPPPDGPRVKKQELYPRRAWYTKGHTQDSSTEPMGTSLSKNCAARAHGLELTSKSRAQ